MLTNTNSSSSDDKLARFIHCDLYIAQSQCSKTKQETDMTVITEVLGCFLFALRCVPTMSPMLALNLWSSSLSILNAHIYRPKPINPAVLVMEAWKQAQSFVQEEESGPGCSSVEHCLAFMWLPWVRSPLWSVWGKGGNARDIIPFYSCGFSYDSVLVNSMSTWHKLESSDKREPQLRRWLHKMDL